MKKNDVLALLRKMPDDIGTDALMSRLCLRQKLETAEAAAETGDVIPHDELEAGCHVLAGTVEVYIGNAHELRGRPGKKTDKRNTVGSKNSCGFAL